MNRQLIAVVVGAVVLFAVALIGARAFTGGDSDAGNVHMTNNGQMMDAGSMMDHMMSSRMGTMSGGQMPGMTYTSP